MTMKISTVFSGEVELSKSERAQVEELLALRYEHIAHHYPSVKSASVTVSKGMAGFDTSITVSELRHGIIELSQQHSCLEKAIRQLFLEAEIQIARPKFA